MKQNSLLSYFQKSSPSKDVQSPLKRTRNEGDSNQPNGDDSSNESSHAPLSKRRKQTQEKPQTTSKYFSSNNSPPSSPLVPTKKDNGNSVKSPLSKLLQNRMKDDKDSASSPAKTSSSNAKKETPKSKDQPKQTKDDIESDSDDFAKPSPSKKAEPKKKAKNSKKKKEEEEEEDFVVEDEPDEGAYMEDVESEQEEEEEEVPVKKTPRKGKSKSSKATEESDLPVGKKSKPSTWATKSIDAENEARDFKSALFKKNKPVQTRFNFLQEVRDENGNSPDDPNYDPRTLYISQTDLNKLTPFERQFWEIKRKYFDHVLFFKKGKFYELYEDDAEIARQKLDLKVVNRVNMKMAGVPESRFIPWASKLISMGYKVARVDQLETSIGMEKRKKEQKLKGKDANLIKRELTKVYTAGTLVDEALIKDSNANYLLAIKEDKNTFGLCFVDTATGEFNLTEIVDDNMRTQLETFLLQTKAKELVYEKNGLSAKTTILIKKHLAPIMNARNAKHEFWDADKTIEEVNKAGYFKTSKTNQKGGPPEGFKGWPDELYKFVNNPVVMSAFGGCVSYLRELKLDVELVSLKRIRRYDPLMHKDSLVLDGQTLLNLEIFQNSFNGTEGTLFQLLDHTCTPFGKRLLKQWVFHPLLQIEAINSRLDAIEDFVDGIRAKTWQPEIYAKMSKLPDLERMISRIHAGAAKLSDFISVLEAFETCLSMVMEMQQFNESFKSQRLQQLTSVGESFPNISPILEDFKNRFDKDKAKEEGFIVPFPGTEEDYDRSLEKIKHFEKQLDNYLKEQRKAFNCPDIVYMHQGKTDLLFQLEIPVEAQKKHPVPSTWKLTSQKKKSNKPVANRYHNPVLKEMIRALQMEQENFEATKKDILQRQLKHFDEHYREWLTVVNVIAELDALMSLAITSSSGDMCRPNFVESEEPFLDIKNMRHPCVPSQQVSSFIPNDLSIGGNSPISWILTGPNMGGKSTLLRQTCIAVIMAQLGCYVAAEGFSLSPVDRIFTRVGARDDIMAGQSTFMIELTETSNMMKHASKHSLIMLDELGRGTSTFDGYAIACSVFRYLTSAMPCRIIFSTHYHKLCEEFEGNPKVGLCHMACHVNEETKDVVFLYKLTEGICPKSYGLNVALMAGLSREIVDKASEIAATFEVNSAFSKYSAKKFTSMKPSVKAYAEINRLLKGGEEEFAQIRELWSEIKE